MKEHLIPLLIIFLLILAGLFLTLSTLMLFQLGYDMADTALGLVFIMPCFYGPAVALLIPLHRRKKEVPRGYAWLGIVAFSAAVVGFIFTAIAYHAVFMNEIEPWMSFCWVGWGLLLPFFISSVTHLREAKPEKIPEGRGQTLKMVIAFSLICICAVLLTGSGLYLHKMSQPHFMREEQWTDMYSRFQEMIRRYYMWEDVDSVTDVIIREDGSDPQKMELEGEEKADTVLLCRVLIHPISEHARIYREDAFVFPSERLEQLRVTFGEDPAMVSVVHGVTYRTFECVWNQYSDAREVQVKYSQGETKHTVTLRWEDE